jgi:hypothetical protein
MAMTTQDWQEFEFKHMWRDIESRQDWRDLEPKRHHKEPRESVDPMTYLAVLAILAVIATLGLFVYAIRTGGDCVPHRPSVNMMYEPQEY